MTLEEILKSQGFTDADIAAQAALLNDPRMRTALEASYGAAVTERDKYKTRVDEYEDWREKTANPAITAAERDAQEARRESARLAEEVRIAKDYGYIPAEDPAKPTARPNAGDPANMAFDPKTHKLVTYDDVAEFSRREGDAIAMASDLASEYQYLHGKSLFEYVGPDGKRGMTALRQEALSQRKPIDQYVSEKFNFAGKRQEQERARQESHDAQIRKETEERVRMELATSTGNPMLRAPMASRVPFIPSRAEGTGQPWEKPKEVLRGERIERAMRNLAKEAVQ